MKNKVKKNIAITLFTAGTMCFSYAFPAKTEGYFYKRPESNGIEQKVDKEYGKIKKIRIINVDGKDKYGSIIDEIVEITYANGTIVTTQNLTGIFGPKRTVERTADGKRIIEEYHAGRERDEWNLTDRIVRYESKGAKIEDWYSFKQIPEKDETTGKWIRKKRLLLRGTKVEKLSKDGKIIEHYNASDYHEGKKSEYVNYISEKIIYPKGTTFDESGDYFSNHHDFFDARFYDLIERKLIEERNEAGKVVRRRFVTILRDDNRGNIETRIEQDSKFFEDPICDGKIDLRQSIKNYRDGVYEKTDYDGDGVADEEIYKKIITLYF